MAARRRDAGVLGAARGLVTVTAAASTAAGTGAVLEAPRGRRRGRRVVRPRHSGRGAAVGTIGPTTVSGRTVRGARR